jgi:hypothetical protein
MASEVFISEDTSRLRLCSNVSVKIFSHKFTDQERRMFKQQNMSFVRNYIHERCDTARCTRPTADRVVCIAGCKDTSSSSSDCTILMNGGVVVYYSGRQPIVALCMATAETTALAKLVVKIKHARAIWFVLQCRQEQTTLINGTCVWVDNDNTAAIAVATGNDFTHATQL